MRDEELSGEEGNSDDDDVDRAEAELSGSEDEEELADETVDETRLRLAKKYLDTVKKETDAAEEEEDNFNFNQDAIAHRLQADVSEAKGRQYRLVADKVAGPALPPRLGHVLAGGLDEGAEARRALGYASAVSSRGWGVELA